MQTYLVKNNSLMDGSGKINFLFVNAVGREVRTQKAMMPQEAESLGLPVMSWACYHAAKVAGQRTQS